MSKRKRKAPSEPVVQLSHKVALDATAEQEDYFRRACGTARFTWNWALAEWNRQFDAGLKPDAMSLKKEFNAIKYKEFPWLEGIHRDAHAQPFTNLCKAWAKFFNDCKAGKPAHAPRFKRKGKCRDSFYANDKLRVTGNIIRLPIVGEVNMRESLRSGGKILGATVSRSAQRWFVSLQVEQAFQKAKRQRTGDGVEGVDLGVKTAVALSSGETIDSPKPLKKMLRRLRIRSRRQSRKLEVAKVAAGIKPDKAIPKGTILPVSNNRKKDAVSLSKLHFRIANVRSDFTHKLTTRLCRENQAVCIEDLNVKGMLRSDKLALAISDVGFGEIKRQMEYKSVLYGTRLIIADRWYPSSKQCSTCLLVLDELPLSVREWACPQCGTHHDRDVNAAKNLKRLATVTALPVASRAVMPCTDVAHAVSGGKVTPVSYDYRLQEGSGQEEKCAHFCVHLE